MVSGADAASVPRGGGDFAAEVHCDARAQAARKVVGGRKSEECASSAGHLSNFGNLKTPVASYGKSHHSDSWCWCIMPLWIS